MTIIYGLKVVCRICQIICWFCCLLLTTQLPVQQHHNSPHSWGAPRHHISDRHQILWVKSWLMEKEKWLWIGELRFYLPKVSLTFCLVAHICFQFLQTLYVLCENIYIYLLAFPLNRSICQKSKEKEKEGSLKSLHFSL